MSIIMIAILNDDMYMIMVPIMMPPMIMMMMKSPPHRLSFFSQRSPANIAGRPSRRLLGRSAECHRCSEARASIEETPRNERKPPMTPRWFVARARRLAHGCARAFHYTQGAGASGEYGSFPLAISQGRIPAAQGFIGLPFCAAGLGLSRCLQGQPRRP
jgi:hypothetical protein